MSSLDRLIDLAKQTGDRLIVHDPIEGRDLVIMEVDEYERLVLRKREKMLEEENDDYGDDWRTQPEDWQSQPEDWRSAGSVLEDRYGEHFGSEWDEDIDDEVNEDEIKIEDIPDFGPSFESEKTNTVPFQAQENTEVWKEEPLIEEEPVFYEEPV